MPLVPGHDGRLGGPFLLPWSRRWGLLAGCDSGLGEAEVSRGVRSLSPEQAGWPAG